MECRLVRITLVAAMLLLGCNAADDGAAGSRAAGAAAPVSPSTPAGLPPASAIPRDFVVSTNEPFWHARVEDGEVVLDGPDVQGRRFAIDSDEEVSGTRVVVARDAGGTITVRLAPGPCQDTMSGAEFPLAAGLEIDGTVPADGCARPAHMPPPRPTGD